MKAQKRIVLVSAIAFFSYLILAALTYFVLWQHTDAIVALENQVFEVTGSYPQVSTCEVVEIIWAAFYVIVPVMFVVFLANVIKPMKKPGEQQASIKTVN